MSPLYKIGDVVQYNGRFKDAFPSCIENYEVSMIVLKTRPSEHCSGGAYHICEVLLGDTTKYYDEGYLELVK